MYKSRKPRRPGSPKSFRSKQQQKQQKRKQDRRRKQKKRQNPEKKKQRQRRKSQKVEESESREKSHSNPKLQKTFRQPDRREKEALLRMRNLRGHPKVIRNATIILAFTSGPSTYEIAEMPTIGGKKSICEKQIRRIIERWNMEGLAGLIPRNSPLLTELGLGIPSTVKLKPTLTEEEVMAEHRKIIAPYDKKLAKLACKVPRNAVDHIELQQERMKLHQEKVNAIMEFDTKLTVENEDLRKQAKMQIRAVAKALGVKVKNQDPNYEANITVPTGGKVGVETEYFLRKRGGSGAKRKNRHKEGNGIFPVLELLGYRDRLDPLFAAIVAKYVTAHSMAEAPGWLRDLGISIDKKQAKEIAERFGADALAAWEEWFETGIPPPGWEPGSAEGLDVAIMVDGGRVKLREYLKGRKLANGYRRFKTDWKQVLEGSVFVFEKRGKQVRKVVSDQLKEFACSTMKDFEHLKRILRAQLELIDIGKARRIVFAADGDKWLWEKVILPLIEELGLPKKKVILFVDYYHATEHITYFADAKWNLSRIKGEAAKKMAKETRASWIKKTSKLLLNHGGEVVVAKMRQHLDGEEGAVLKALETEIGFFTKRYDQMRYPELKKMGLPVGTGAIESLIKRTNNARTKGNSVFWHNDNVDAVLHLVCQHRTGRWEETVKSVAYHRARRVTPPHTVVTAAGLWPKQRMEDLALV